MINEGDYVIGKMDSVQRLFQVRRERPLFLGKRKFNLGSVIGHQYGSFFDVKRDGSFVIRSGGAPECDISLPRPSEVKDNRSVENASNPQKLTTDDIESFKADGVPGEEIIKIIVENSSSFKDKSVYSQEKYLKKKQSKYLEVMQILKPNTRNLVETFYSYSPQKICNLRIDSLAQMLTFCNVMSGGKYVVVDSVLGLLTAAVLERLGSEGLALQVCMTLSPTSIFMQAIEALNIPSDQLKSMLYTISFDKLTASSESVETKDSSTLSSSDSSLNNNCVSTDRESSKEPTEKSLSRIQQRLENQMKVMNVLSKKNMDGLLVAIKHHPSCVVWLLDYLSYSRPFAIFCPYQQPLVECYSILKARGDVILLNMSETWLRKYQVLPERTHPEYSMSGNGGFLLTGIKVEKKI